MTYRKRQNCRNEKISGCKGLENREMSDYEVDTQVQYCDLWDPWINTNTYEKYMYGSWFPKPFEFPEW